MYMENPCQVHTEGDRMKLKVGNNTMLQTKLNIRPINDDMIKSKMEYKGKNEMIHWIISHNPFKRDLPIISIMRTLTDNVFDSMMPLVMTSDETQFIERFKITTQDQIQRDAKDNKKLVEKYPNNYDYKIHYVQSLLQKGELKLAEEKLRELNVSLLEQRPRHQEEKHLIL
jgi:hypothetical protein